MRKLIIAVLAVLIGLSLTPVATVFAQGESSAPADSGPADSDPSPELIIQRYDIDGGYLTPGKTGTLTIVFLNTSDDHAVRNVKLSFSEKNGQILSKDAETRSVNSIAASGQYTWRLRIFATGTAESKPHVVTITMEYEGQNANPVTTTSNISLLVQGGAQPTTDPTPMTTSNISLLVQSGAQPTADPTPKLIVEEYDTGCEYLVPGERKTLAVIFRNTSRAQTIKNVKLSFFEESVQILPGGTGTQFVESIKNGTSYEWQFNVFAIRTAESRPYAAMITMEYEDSNGTPIIMTDTIYLYVHQPVRLEHENISFPPRLTQMDTVPFSVTVMNLGKGNILNALLTYKIPGLSNSSSVLIGTVLPGESKTGTANFRVDKDVSGEVSGNLVISYEDEYGETYKKEIALSTVIEERAETTALETATQAEAGNNNRNFWFIYALAGIIAVLILAFFITKYIKQRKQIKADEMRL